MSQAVPWLPDACLASERTGRRLREAVAVWSRRWMARRRWQSLGALAEAAQVAEDDGWSVLRTGGRAAIGGAPQAVMRLALAMLGEGVRTDLSPRDHKFLRRVASDALDDLTMAVDQLLPGRDHSAGPSLGRPWALSIGPVGEPLLQVSLARSDLCLLARQAYPRNAIRPIDTRSSAITDLRVPISAHLGTATIDLAQLEGLELGDVLVLDRPSTAPAMLQVAGRSTALPCTLGQRDGALVLHMAESA